MLSSLQTQEKQKKPDPNFDADRRRYKRIPLTLSGRFMRENKQEYFCRLINISIGEADVKSDALVEDNERIVIYLDHLGGLEGRVTRHFEGGFGLSLQATVRRQQKLAAQLTWLINQHELGLSSQRRAGHERINVGLTPITAVLDSGLETQCTALDVSISGARLASQARPQLGSEISINALRAKVVRHHDRGFSVEFNDIQHVDIVRRNFG